MENNNIEFETTGGHKIILKPFITGFDKRSIDQIMFEGAETDKDGKFNPSSFNRQKNKAQDRTFEIVVVSVDGKTGDVAKEVLSLPHRDAQEIIEKINEITVGKKKV